MRGVICCCVVLLCLVSGCAHVGDRSPADKEQALADCRSEADTKHRSRYTDEWNAFVDECMREKGY